LIYPWFSRKSKLGVLHFQLPHATSQSRKWTNAVSVPLSSLVCREQHRGTGPDIEPLRGRGSRTRTTGRRWKDERRWRDLPDPETCTGRETGWAMRRRKETLVDLSG
jgi:hypothetical protein